MDLKEQGNKYFANGKYEDAIDVYSKALKEVDKDLATTILNNRAACYLKLERFDESVSDCNKVLDNDPQNVKALYRRAQGHVGMRKIEQAFSDLKLLLDIDKNNKPAIDMIQKVRSLAQDMNSTSSQTMSLLNSIKDMTDEKPRTSALRKILGSILEDEHLALAIVREGAVTKLWDFRVSDPLSLKVIAKLSEFSSCYVKVLDSIDQEEIVRIILGEGEYTETEETCRAAALSTYWHLLKHEDSVRESNGDHVCIVDEQNVLKSVVKSLNADEESIRRVGIEASVRVCADNKVRCLKFIELDGMSALASVIQRNLERNEPIQQASLVLGQILPTLKDDNMIKTHALSFCKTNLESEDVHKQILGTACLDAIFLANRDLGYALVSEDGLIERLKVLSQFGTERTQALVVDIYSHVANSEDGRSLLAGDCTDALHVLVTSDNSDVRSSAAVTLAKLNALDFDASSEKGIVVLSSVVGLLSHKASKDEHKKGVEAISFVITDADVKNMLTQGKGANLLSELIELAKRDKATAKEHYAFGLAFIFENLTMSEDDKKKEKLREMEVTAEQWEQFEKLTKSQTRKSGQQDPPENVNFRIQAFVEAQGIEALRALVLNGASEQVCGCVARAFCNIASVQQVRGKMLAQGAARALYKLTSGGPDKTKKFAAWALARILITTDPHVLKDNDVMDSIAPMVYQVRHSDEELLIFECCMALTNIATVSLEAKQKLVNCNAIPAFEYAQYSENLLVRRAATEALNNLIPTEEVIEWLCRPDKLKLWMMFCQAYEEDLLTACAATGALANLAVDPRLAEALSKKEGGDSLKILVSLAKCGNMDIEHRAVVCLLYLIDSWPNGTGKAEISKAGAIEAFEKVIKENPDSPVADAATDGLTALRS